MFELTEVMCLKAVTVINIPVKFVCYLFLFNFPCFLTSKLTTSSHLKTVTITEIPVE
jgi:hypothetical protein